LKGGVSIKDQVRLYISELSEGTTIYANDIAKQFNFSNASRASKEISLQDKVKKKGKGVFVKE
jgi:hypothetical protein